MLKIRWSHDRLIFYIGIPYMGKTVFILRRGQSGNTHHLDETFECLSEHVFEFSNLIFLFYINFVSYTVFYCDSRQR